MSSLIKFSRFLFVFSVYLHTLSASASPDCTTREYGLDPKGATAFAGPHSPQIHVAIAVNVDSSGEGLETCELRVSSMRTLAFNTHTPLNLKGANVCSIPLNRLRGAIAHDATPGDATAFAKACHHLTTIDAGSLTSCGTSPADIFAVEPLGVCIQLLRCAPTADGAAASVSAKGGDSMSPDAEVLDSCVAIVPPAYFSRKCASGSGALDMVTLDDGSVPLVSVRLGSDEKSAGHPSLAAQIVAIRSGDLLSAMSTRLIDRK